LCFPWGYEFILKYKLKFSEITQEGNNVNVIFIEEEKIERKEMSLFRYIE
jgi:hypothetical protein